MAGKFVLRSSNRNEQLLRVVFQIGLIDFIDRLYIILSKILLALLTIL